MGNRSWNAFISFGIVTTVFLFVASASEQSPFATKLSPAVKEYVKFDDGVIALTLVRVIDGTGQAARSEQTLVIRDGVVAALGDAASTPIPPGARVLDLSGHTVFPGIVGMHDHMFYPQPTNMEGRRVRGVLQFELTIEFHLPAALSGGRRYQRSHHGERRALRGFESQELDR
jgi:hypothetical protein